jgi:hypothetical protein
MKWVKTVHMFYIANWLIVRQQIGALICRLQNIYICTNIATKLDIQYVYGVRAEIH